MTVYSISSFLASILCLTVAIISLLTRKTRSHLALASILFLISIWTLFPLLTTIVKTSELQLNIARFLYMAAAFVPYAFLYLTLSVLAGPETKFEKTFLFLCLIMSIFFALFSLHHTYIRGVGEYGSARFIIPGPSFSLFIAYFILVCGWTFVRLIYEYPKTSGLRKNQLKYFFAGFIFAYIGGGIHFLSSFIQKEPFPHDILIASFTIILGYAILRFRLMDFNLIIRWGLAYSILIFTLALLTIPLIVTSEWISSRLFHGGMGLPTLIIIGVFVFLFDPLRRRVTYFVDKIIFQSPDFQSILINIEKALTNSNNLPELTSHLTEELKEIWKVDHVGFVIWNFRKNQFDLLPQRAFTNQTISNINENIPRNDFLVRTLETERRLFKNGIIIEDEVKTLGNRASLGERTTFLKVLRTMRWLGAFLCIPLMADGQLVGFIVLGPKKNETIYNNEDKKFLSHVVSKVAEPIRNLSIS